MVHIIYIVSNYSEYQNLDRGLYSEKMNEPYWTLERTREFIAIVRNNIALYAKGSRMFKNKQAKDLTWQSIGAILVPSCPGDIAAKRFKHLRDTFQKERKKILATIPPSGAGSESKRYESTWEYYNDLLFLAEHVTSRKTISNYSGCSESSLTSDDSLCLTDGVHLSHNLLKRKANEPLVIELQQEELKPESIVYSSPSTSLQSVSPYDTSDNESFLGNVNESNMISCPNESSLLNPTIEAQTSVAKMSSQCETLLTGMSSTIRGKAIKSILQPKVPKSNVIKKERDQDVIQSCIQQLSKSASEVAAKIAHPTETTDIDGLKFLQYLLKYVPEDKKLLCFSDICRVAEIYRKGGCPNIIEQKQD